MRLNIELDNGIQIQWHEDGPLMIYAPRDQLLKAFVDTKDAVPSQDVMVITVEKIVLGLTGA